MEYIEFLALKYKNINKYKSILFSIFSIIEKNKTSKNYRWVSLRFLKESLETNRDIKNISQIINYFVFLGLLEKLTDEEILEGHRKISYQYSENNKQRISYFRIPVFTEDRKKQIEERLLIKIAVTKLTYEYLKAKTNKYIAEQVYTCYIDDRKSKEKKVKTVTKSTLRKREYKKNILDRAFKNLIETKEVFTKTDLILELNRKDAENIINTYIPIILKKYSYEYIRSSKNLKEKYNLSFKNYLNIFIKTTTIKKKQL